MPGALPDPFDPTACGQPSFMIGALN